MKREKTAVEWLEEQIKGMVSKKGTHGVVVIQTIEDVLNDLFDQAKQMEREKIIASHKEGQHYANNFEVPHHIETEQYYESKYGKDETNMD